MPNGSEALDFEAVLKTTDFKKELATLRNDIKGFVNTTTTETKKIDNAFSNIAKVAAGAFAFTQLSDLPSKIIQVRGEFQNLEIAFTTMLKSKSAADKLLGEITQFAAKTPFTLTDVATGAKQLLAYGSSVKTVISEIRTLGDVSAGVSAPIGDLIYLYGTLRTQGRAYSVDIRQFAARGIPIYEELAKVLKINSSEVQSFVEAGKVGFKEVEQAFKNMTTNGGIFEGLTEKTSKSLTGLLSNFKDAVDRAFNDLGKSQEGLIATGITTATSLVDNYQEVLDILTVLVVTYGAYRAAIIATNIVQSASAVSGAVSAWFSLAGSIKSAADAQALFNLTTKANPIGLALAALAALVTYLYVYADETKKIVSANELLVDVNKSVVSSVRTQQTEINSLVSVLKNQSVAESQRLEAYEKLKSINPDIVKGLDFQAAKTADLTKEVNNYILSLEKRLRLEATQGKLKEAIDQQITAEEDLAKAKERVAFIDKNKALADKRLKDIRIGDFDKETGLSSAQSDVKKAELALLNANKVVQTIVEKTEKIYATGSSEQIRNKIKDLEMLQGAIKNKLSPAYKKYEDQIVSLNKQLNEGAKPITKSFSQRLAEANDVGNLLLLKSQAKTENEIDALSKKIEEKKKDLDKGSGDYKKLQKAYEQLNPKKTTNKKEDEVFPFGSLKYWEDVSRKAEEAISKLTPEQSAKVAQFQQQKLNADKQAEAIRKQFTIRSFDEEIEYKKQQYELYNRWVEFEGQGAANANFSELIRQGESFKAYLEGQILALQAKIEAGTATSQDNENIVILKSTLKVEDNTFEKYKESIFKAKLEVGSLTEYIEKLKEEQAKVTGKDELLFLSEESTNAKKERKQIFKDFVNDNNIAGAEVLRIQKYYSDLRTELDQQYANNKTEIYQSALNKINQSESKELSERASNEVVNENKVYKELERIEGKKGQAAVEQKIKNVKKQQEILEKANAKESKEYKDKIEEQKALELELRNLKQQSTVEYIGLIFQLGSEFSNVDGIVGDIGKSFSFLGSQAENLFKLFKGTATGGDIANFGLTIVKGIISSIVEQTKLNKELYNNKIQGQLTYNELLNEQIRLDSILNGNGFVKNYEGIVGDAQRALIDASKTYYDLLKKIEFSAGAIIKRHAGFLGVGAFDVLAPTVLVYTDLIKTAVDGTKELNIERAKALIDNNLVDESTKKLLQNAITAQEQIDEAQKQISEVILDLTGQLGSTLRDGLVNAFKDGTSAAQAFGDSVGQVLETIISQTLFSTVFGQAFDDLKKNFEASFSQDGDKVLTDDLVDFYKKYPDLVKVFTDGLSDAKKEAEKAGLDIFKTGTSATSGGLSGSIKGITEETAGLLAGQFNAIRITGATHLQVSRDSLLQLTTIANNSRYLQKLESIDLKLGKSNNDLRAGGL